jgi:transglutaminase superfamily protein
VIDSRAQPSEAITSRALELTRGLGTPRQRLQALYTFVSTEIRYVSLALGAGRLEPRPAAEVLATQYGDCKDKHVLLASLARAIDIDLRPVLISSVVTVDDRVPSPTQFDHLITVRTGGNAAERDWMDTTSGVLPPGVLFNGLRNKRALLIMGDGSGRGSGGSAAFVTTPADIGIPTTTTVDISGTIDEKVLTTRVVRRLTGDLEFLMRLAFRQTDQDLRRKVAEEQAKDDGLSKGTIQDVSFKDEGAGRGVEFTYRASHPFSFTYDKPWQIWIPSPTLELPAAPDEPGTPIELGTPVEMIVSASYEVPPALRVRPPVAVTLDRDFATYRSTYAVDGRILRVERRLRTLLNEIPPAQAESYRTFTRAIDTDVRQRFSVDPIARTASSPVTADELNAAGNAAIEKRQLKEAVACD